MPIQFQHYWIRKMKLSLAGAWACALIFLAGCGTTDPLVGTWIYRGSNRQATPVHVTSFNLIFHDNGTATSISRTKEKGKLVDHKVDSVYEKNGNLITLRVNYQGTLLSWDGEMVGGRLVLRDSEGGESFFIKALE